MPATSLAHWLTFFSPISRQPETSALLDALEQSACNPEIAIVLAKSMQRILQLSAEKTVASFKALDAVPRVLKVACIQAEESRRSATISTSVQGYLRADSPEIGRTWHQCMNACMELFMEFWSIADDAKSLVLHSPTCIDCLFQLFWEEGLRNNVLVHILDLMKVFLSYTPFGVWSLLLSFLWNSNNSEVYHLLRLRHYLKGIK